MKTGKRQFISLFDIVFILIVAAVVALFIFFVSPTGKTVTVDYTLTVTEGDTEILSEGDVLTVISGGCLGTVTKTGNGLITASAEAEYHAGRYYSGSSALKEGGEYVICVGENKLVCILGGISKR